MTSPTAAGEPEAVVVPDADNRYRVKLEEVSKGWRVVILDPEGEAVSRRVCRDETEARTYASAVRQHVYWLSESRFRSYYQLP
ncbi:MAG: hypothetical protein M3O88_01845 [Actinomycetota bacterium]|nr:hypothetical protein [Actinomycetota bacterium]